MSLEQEPDGHGLPEAAHDQGAFDCIFVLNLRDVARVKMSRRHVQREDVCSGWILLLLTMSEDEETWSVQAIYAHLHHLIHCHWYVRAAGGHLTIFHVMTLR